MPLGVGHSASVFSGGAPRIAGYPALAVLAAFGVGSVGLLAGCQVPAQPVGPTEVVVHVPDYDAFVDASLSLLRHYDFPPDRVDRTRGLIIPRPTTSAQWFEWWRVDAPGGYQMLESSVSSVRRIVTVNLDPLDAATAPAPETPAAATRPAGTTGITDASEIAATPTSGRYRVRVLVEKSRDSAPERQITTASGAMSLYSADVPTVEGVRGPRSRKAVWVPLGRDGLLEMFLLDHLTKALPDLEVAD